MSDQVTADQVKEAAMGAGITRIETRDCSLCGYMLAYLIRDGQLYFDAGCNCSSYGPSAPQPREWQSAANWINMQTDEHREKIKAQFGFQGEAQ